MKSRYVNVKLLIENYLFDPVNVKLVEEIGQPSILSFMLPYNSRLLSVLPGTRVVAYLLDTSLPKADYSDIGGNDVGDMALPDEDPLLPGYVEWFSGFIIDIPDMITMNTESPVLFQAMSDIGIMKEMGIKFMDEHLSESPLTGAKKITLDGNEVLPDWGASSLSFIITNLLAPLKLEDEEAEKELKKRFYGLLYGIFMQKRHYRSFFRQTELLDNILVYINSVPFDFMKYNSMLGDGKKTNIANLFKKSGNVWDFFSQLISSFYHDIIHLHPARIVNDEFCELKSGYLPTNVAEIYKGKESVKNFYKFKLDLEEKVRVARYYIKPALIDSNPPVENVLTASDYSSVVYTHTPGHTRTFVNINFQGKGPKISSIYPAQWEDLNNAVGYYNAHLKRSSNSSKSVSSALFKSGITGYMSNEEKMRNRVLSSETSITPFSFTVSKTNRKFTGSSFDLIRELAKDQYIKEHSAQINIVADFNVRPVVGFSMAIMSNDSGPSFVGYLTKKITHIDLAGGQADTTFTVISPKIIDRPTTEKDIVGALINLRDRNEFTNSFFWNTDKRVSELIGKMGSKSSNLIVHHTDQPVIGIKELKDYKKKVSDIFNDLERRINDFEVKVLHDIPSQEAEVEVVSWYADEWENVRNTFDEINDYINKAISAAWDRKKAEDEKVSTVKINKYNAKVDRCLNNAKALYSIYQRQVDVLKGVIKDSTGESLDDIDVSVSVLDYSLDTIERLKVNINKMFTGYTVPYATVEQSLASKALCYPLKTKGLDYVVPEFRYQEIDSGSLFTDLDIWGDIAPNFNTAMKLRSEFYFYGSDAVDVWYMSNHGKKDLRSFLYDVFQKYDSFVEPSKLVTLSSSLKAEKNPRGKNIAKNQLLDISIGEIAKYKEIFRDAYVRGTFVELNGSNEEYFKEGVYNFLYGKVLSYYAPGFNYDSLETIFNLDYLWMDSVKKSDVLDKMRMVYSLKTKCPIWLGDPGLDISDIFVWALTAAYSASPDLYKSAVDKWDVDRLANLAVASLEGESPRVHPFPLSTRNINLLRIYMVKTVKEAPWVYAIS